MLRRTSLVALALIVVAALVLATTVHAAERLHAARALWVGARAPVLAYHELVPGARGGNPEIISVRRFVSEMDELAAQGYRPVSLDAFAGRAPLPARSVLITFDDGYESTYRYAYPVLKRHHFPATVFLITDYVGRPGYLSWDEVRAMSGLVEFGGHTADLHGEIGGRPALGVVSRAAALADLRRCRQAIAAEVGRAPTAFAYPFGSVTPRTAAVVRQAGFELAFAGQARPPAGVPPRFAQPRFPVLPFMSSVQFRLFALGEPAGARDWLDLFGTTFVHGWHALARRV